MTVGNHLGAQFLQPLLQAVSGEAVFAIIGLDDGNVVLDGVGGFASLEGRFDYTAAGGGFAQVLLAREAAAQWRVLPRRALAGDSTPTTPLCLLGGDTP